MGSNAALIVFEFERKLRLFETEFFGPKLLSFRFTSIKKVTKLIFREFPLYLRHKSAIHSTASDRGRESSNVSSYGFAKRYPGLISVQAVTNRASEHCFD